MHKDWNYRTHKTDILNLDEKKLVHKKSHLRRKNFFEILRSEVCMKWEK